MENTEDNNQLLNGEHVQETIPAREEVKLENDEPVISEEEIGSWSKAQLSDKLEEYLTAEDIYSIMPAAKLIKDKLDELAKEAYEHKLKMFVQDGGIAEDFAPKTDLLMEKAEHAWKSLNAKRVSQRKQKEKSAIENLSVKKMIIEELKELMKGEEKFSVAYGKFQALQAKWRATGNVPLQDSQTLKENYYFFTGKFYDMLKISNELNELDRKKNNENKITLCEKAEQLAAEPSLKKATAGMRHLQEEWSEIRNTSREMSDQLWQRFRAATDKIIKRQKEYNKQVKQQQQTNLEAKTALCLQIEKLSETEFTSHKVCREVAEKEEAIWEAWQKIGFVPKSDNGDCWKRFKKGRQLLHHLMDLFYAKQRGEFSANLEKKTALCLKAESLMDSTDWEATANTLKRLQVEWKGIGQVAAKDSEIIWARFRKACNHFFDRKTNQVAEKENALKANIQAKETLIAKVDSFQPSQDLAQATEELKKLQEEWSASGEVPVKENDRLNNSFGRAVEKLLDRMKTGSGVDDKTFYRLKYEQMLKSAQGKAQIEKERSVIQNKIKELQAEVNQLENNLGFFGTSKKPNPLVAEYQQKVEKIKGEIKELTAKLKWIPVV